MKRKFYLLSIIPNQQARLELQALRHRLFQELGFASALAFEPVIPLAYSNELPDSAAFAGFAGGTKFQTLGRPAETVTLSETMKRTIRRNTPPSIETGTLIPTRKALFLRIKLQPEYSYAHLHTTIQSALRTTLSTDYFLTASRGIFLAANEFADRPQAARKLRELLYENSVSFNPARRWSSSRIGVYSISIAGDPWWHHVEWALEWKIQLKQVRFFQK